MHLHDTICALSTPLGQGALALIRLSGPDAYTVMRKVFEPKNQQEAFASHKVYFGEIRDDDQWIDEVLVTYFKKPHSYTGEDMVEISCHGSSYIQKCILELLIRKGCRMAEGGEFSLRAFMNGKMDLLQTEAVGDLIASQSKLSHQLAFEHMRGGFSLKIKQLRADLLRFASLLELELDFAEEEVEFADRNEIQMLIVNLKIEIHTLLDSFQKGNVLKNGIPVAIVGKPNVGKSTLLNALLNEDRAIVSDIPGTTRDTIEDCINIQGYTFRFIDTAGLRASTDVIESFGIERSYKAMEEAMLILYMVDKEGDDKEEIAALRKKYTDKTICILQNKIDLLNTACEQEDHEILFISAKKKIHIDRIMQALLTFAEGLQSKGETLISNIRHYEALHKAYDSLLQVETAFDQKLPTDLVMVHVKDVLMHLGEITGEITNDDILHSIFKDFCIGK